MAQNYNARYALDNHWFWTFLQNTQAETLEKLQKQSSDWQRKILERYDRLVKKYGLLHLLKKGLAVDDAFFHLMYPAPLAGSSESVKQNFEQNIFSSTRQVRYSLGNTLEEIDLVLFINGLPFATLELKNPWTGQTVRYHGQKQYREDRDINQPLLNFGRCLVHMAVDTDEVYMTTKLSGKSTFILPFNKGHNHGQGNPPNPYGHKMAYLWEAVFSRLSVANMIQHFVRLDGSSKEPINKRSLFYLAFTAPPKNSTLEKFGVKQTDGSFEPFHLYSMKQAIEEGFILDVPANYTTYKSSLVRWR